MPCNALDISLAYIIGRYSIPMPKIVKPLSQTQVDKIKPIPGKNLTLFDGDGLYLLVKPTGAKLWRFLYKAPDRRRRLTSFGDAFRTTLEEARKKSAETLSMLSQGMDPQNVKNIVGPAAADTRFKAVAEAMLEARRKITPIWSESYMEKAVSRLGRLVLPFLGPLPIDKIDRSAVKAVLDRLQAQGNFGSLKKVTQLSQRENIA